MGSLSSWSISTAQEKSSAQCGCVPRCSVDRGVPSTLICAPHRRTQLLPQSTLSTHGGFLGRSAELPASSKQGALLLGSVFDREMHRGPGFTQVHLSVVFHVPVSVCLSALHSFSAGQFCFHGQCCRAVIDTEGAAHV